MARARPARAGTVGPGGGTPTTLCRVVKGDGRSRGAARAIARNWASVCESQKPGADIRTLREQREKSGSAAEAANIFGVFVSGLWSRLLEVSLFQPSQAR